MSSNASRWPDLFVEALRVLDAVPPGRLVGVPPWTFGGGTALALQIDHRISFDVDLFVPGTSLMELRPPRNAAARALMARPDVTMQHPGHYLRYEFPFGEIDFLSPALQTERGWETMTVMEREVAVETPVEIAVKKVRYRGARLTARDAFDIACIEAAGHDLTTAFAEHVPDVMPVALAAMDRLAALGGTEALRADIDPTEAGAARIADALGSCRALFERVGTAPIPSTAPSTDHET